MIVLEENKLVETFFGFIENPKDGLILFQAVKDGVLPSVQRRLSVEQRIQIKSGSVFVFNETESNIRRWTDGRTWTPSRVQGDFLIYRELEKNMDKAKRDKKSLKRNLSLKTLDAKKALSSRYESLNIPTFRPDKFFIKIDGLIKKTMSVVIKGQTYHMISYYRESDVLNNKLSTPSEVKSLQKIVISDELLNQLKQPTQKAPGIEEITKLNNLNNNSTRKTSNNNEINNYSNIKKQPYINISASEDNTVDINENSNSYNNNKSYRSKERAKSHTGNSDTKGKNIEEMITQIGDNMHFLKISQNNSQILNNLQMNPELLHHHITQLLNEKVNSTSNLNFHNNNENLNIHSLNNIKNNLNLNSVTTTNHTILNHNATSISHPNSSVLDNQTRNTISNLHFSNMEKHHHHKNYHKLDNNKLHLSNVNQKKIHTNDELLNFILHLNEKGHSSVKDEDIPNHELLYNNINTDLINNFNGNLHDLHEIIMQEKNTDHHKDSSTSELATVNNDIINLLANENIQRNLNNQELIEYLINLNEQKSSHNNLNNSLLNNVNNEILQHHLNNNNNYHPTSVATTSDSNSIYTTLGQSLNMNHSEEYKDIKSLISPLNNKLHHEHKITSEPLEKDLPENLNENIEYHHQIQNSSEINLQNILQILNSNQNLDLEALQNLLQYAYHEQNRELIQFLETAIQMIIMEQDHHISNQQSINNHSLNNTSEHIDSDLSLSILNNNDHTNQVHSELQSSSHNDLSHQDLLNYSHLNNISNTLLDNNSTDSNLYTHLTQSIDASNSIPVSHIQSVNMDAMNSIPQQFIHSLTTESLTPSTTTDHSFNSLNYSIFHNSEEDHMDHDHNLIIDQMDHDHQIQPTIIFN
jgi:hypothetical protein